MEIETKYNIGDKVWMIYDNKPCEFEIKSISVIKRYDTVTYFDEINVLYRYGVCCDGMKDIMDIDEREKRFFDTKELLRKSLE